MQGSRDLGNLFCFPRTCCIHGTCQSPAHSLLGVLRREGSGAGAGEWGVRGRYLRDRRPRDFGRRAVLP